MTTYELFSLLGGVGLFLYGMTIMSVGLRNACGEKLKTILEYATKNKLISVMVGIAVTMLIQSSSATDVMVIGFVNSGLLHLSQAIGVIMGANIGTTVTAQITAFNISAYAPVILFVGAVMYLFIGKPIRFCSSNSIEEECARICDYLMEEITQIACSLPEHTVVPYPNIPKKNYPSNIPPKVSAK